MSNPSEQLVVRLADLRAHFDDVAVSYCTKNDPTKEHPGTHGHATATARGQVYDAAMQARALVEQLEALNDTMVVARRVLRW